MLTSVRLKECLLGIEMVLGIDYTEKNIEGILKQSIRNIENNHNIQLSGTVSECMELDVLNATNCENFLSGLTEHLKALSLYLNVSMYRAKYGDCNLATVNYLGFAKDQLFTILKVFQYEKVMANVEGVLQPLMTAIDYIEVTDVKRLLVVMIILYKLGIYEGASIVASLLYLGSY